MIVQHRNFGTQSIIRCGTHYDHNYGSHIHQFSEVLYCIDGSLVSTVDGRDEIMRAGDVSLITPLKVHSTHTDEHCTVFICVCSNDFLLDFIPQKELYAGYEGSVFTPSPALGAYLADKFIDAASNFCHIPETRSYRATKACLHAICDEFTATHPQIDKPVYSEPLSLVILYMNEHFSEDITLGSVAKALGYSSGYISHCLEALPQMTFSSLLNSLRIEHAKNLLLTQKHTNIDIAFECGFGCERSFYRAFTAIVGMTPKEYVAHRSKAK